MSYQGGIAVTVKGLRENIANNSRIVTGIPQTNMRILRDASTYFVYQAKVCVHKISGDLARSIKVDSITPNGAIVSSGSGLNYARREEDRGGKRRIPPHTPHPYMMPAAYDTNRKMPELTKKYYNELVNRIT